MEEIDRRIAKGQRTLITTLTKRMAEDLTDHLKERGVKTAYIHSDIDTLDIVEIRFADGYWYFGNIAYRLRCVVLPNIKHEPQPDKCGVAG